MSGSADRLYDLLPAYYRERDEELGSPLKALLQVIGEQVNVVEDDISQLYENWFIETCEDWVVPYLADLIGWRPVHEAGEAGDVETLQGRERNKALVPRREVANTLRYRRRKGTLALLELLARDVAGWPARAVELRLLLGWTQNVRHLRPLQGRTADLRAGVALERLEGPFEEIAHTVEVRRLASRRTPGRYDLPAVGLFLWWLRPYSVTGVPAYCAEDAGPHCFTFSVLGNDTQLFVHPQPEAEPTDIAGEVNVPIRITRRALDLDLKTALAADGHAARTSYYGEGKSFRIWRGEPGANGGTAYKEVPPQEIVVADLTDWQYRPQPGRVIVDPELGRIAFPPRRLPKRGVQVTYHYGFSADLGGGEYDRPIRQPVGSQVFQVGKGKIATLREALERWQKDAPDKPGVIEITDSGVYTERLRIKLAKDQRLQIRAARRQRPVLRLLDWQSGQPDSLCVHGKAGSEITLDGLLITGRSVLVQGDLAAVTIRHSTLVPGWGLTSDCHPRRPAEPSLELIDVHGCVTIEHSIVGSIQVVHDEVLADPIPIRISDSILDATSEQREALGAPGHPAAHARLTIERSTVFGEVEVHAIELAENSIFEGRLQVARRQIGCMRFCSYLPGPRTRTPRRFQCQPDLVELAAVAGITDPAERVAAREGERRRVRPQFESRRYGASTYARLAASCAREIRRGADDESEMGVFHDLYEPQREANLRARLDEYTPAGLDAGPIFAS